MGGRKKRRGEFQVIGAIRGRHVPSERVAIGIGDDCAAINVSNDELCLITTDMLLEGTHFTLGEATPEEIGWKSIACSLSDIAAMGCEPTAAVASVGFSPVITDDFIDRFHNGITDICRRYAVDLVGGDITSGEGKLAVCVTLLGRDAGPPPVTRAGAEPGDAILVTGSLGGSVLGKHLRFHPRVSEGIHLNRSADLHAMIDISDGLAADLNHIAEESGVGAVIDAESIPVSQDARKLARESGRPPVEHALSDGEDYELLFTVSPEDAEQLIAEQPLAVSLTRIGETTSEKGLAIRQKDGSVEPLAPKGWEHLK
ncbi:MAG: thiamine-monophosphate kinase [Planctomycetes bacterium]|nr:thiamine-monophosphate kinase [Planctomycetota bacterium]